MDGIALKRIYELKRKYGLPFKGKDEDMQILNIDFSYLDLEGVDFSGIHPKNITFYGCILDNCNFSRVCLCNINLRNASCKNTDFR